MTLTQRLEDATEGTRGHTPGPWRFHDGNVKGPADGSAELFDFITANGREYRAQKQPNFWHFVSLWRPHVPNVADALLAALIGLVEVDDDELVMDTVEVRKRLAAARAAIAKAKASPDTEGRGE